MIELTLKDTQRTRIGTTGAAVKLGDTAVYDGNQASVSSRLTRIVQRLSRERAGPTPGILLSGEKHISVRQVELPQERADRGVVVQGSSVGVTFASAQERMSCWE